MLMPPPRSRCPRDSRSGPGVLRPGDFAVADPEGDDSLSPPTGPPLMTRRVPVAGRRLRGELYV